MGRSGRLNEQLDPALHRTLRATPDRIDRQIRAVEHTVTTTRGGGAMDAQQAFDGFDHAQYEQEVAAQQAAAPAAPAEPEAPDYTAELQQLAQLRDSGVITDEEFEAKKKQLLGL